MCDVDLLLVLWLYRHTSSSDQTIHELNYALNGCACASCARLFTGECVFLQSAIAKLEIAVLSPAYPFCNPSVLSSSQTIYTMHLLAHRVGSGPPCFGRRPMRSLPPPSRLPQRSVDARNRLRCRVSAPELPASLQAELDEL